MGGGKGVRVRLGLVGKGVGGKGGGRRGRGRGGEEVRGVCGVGR